jgi:PTH2 family peptidyl-tRNA hydrolase
MVILVRKDLKMSIGKIASQVSHAVLLAYQHSQTSLFEKDKQSLINWEKSGSTKIALSVDNLPELQSLRDKAAKALLPLGIVSDAGKTELIRGTITTLAIGPAQSEEIDKITGHLKLL